MKRKVLLQMLISGILLTVSIKSDAQQTLIHYWHFNNFTSTSSTLVDPSTITPLIVDSTIIKTDTAKVMYRAIPGTSSSYLSYWDMLNTGDTTNARYGTVGGNALRPRNPWDSMQLVWVIPSNGFKNLTIKYACQRSGSGPQVENYDYSVDGGTTFITTGLSVTSFVVTSTANPMSLASVSINDQNAFNNKNLVFRIRFSSNSTPPVTAGNNRIDNFTVEGDPMPLGPPSFNIGQINSTNPVTGVTDSINGHYTIKGLVYGFNQSSTGIQFLLRDNTGGITISHNSKTFGYSVTEGDSVVIPGTVQTFRGLAEFVPDTIMMIASGKSVKNPSTVTSIGESNENDVVKMNNLVFYTTPSGANWPTSTTNILCHTQGLTDTIVVRVISGSGLAGSPLPTFTLFNVAGMVQQFSSSTGAPYAFNGYEIVPRASADVISGIAPPDAMSAVSTISGLNSITLSWTKPANYNNSTLTTLVFLKSGSAITQGTPNLNPTNYTANIQFGSGTAFQNDANAKCVLNGDSSSVTITGLSQATAYYALIYSVRLGDSSYSTSATKSTITTNNFPNPVSGLAVNGTTSTSAKISWTKPVGYDNTAHSTIVFVKASSSITAGTPTKGVSAYVANTAFGSGTNYQNDAAAFCVYNGDTNTVTVSNLVQGTTYNVLIWVVRNSDSMYAATSSIANGNALPPPPTVKLIHYWNFNTLPNTFTASSIANSFKNAGVTADYSSLDTAKAKIYYRTFAGVSDTYLTFFDNVGGDTMNTRMNAPAGLGFRARNPSDSMQLMFYIPTQHYKNIKVSYACEKSSIASGQYQQNYDYSIDAGKTWKTSGLNITFDSTIGIAYTPVYLSFPNDTLTGNNPNLILRIKFIAGPLGIGSPTGLSGNNRFDNVAVEGDTTTVTPQPVITTGISEVLRSNNDYVMYPNPTNGDLFISSKTTDTKHIAIINITGQVMSEYSDNGKEIKMDISNLSRGIYFVRVTENNAVSTMKLIRN